jgi:hypothetical protein
MGLATWTNKKTKNLDILDFGLTKLAVFFGTLFIVKFLPALLSVEWYWYLIIAIILSVRPMYRFFSR